MFKALFGNLTPTAAHRGWPRVVADADTWRSIGESLREDKLDLLGLWGDGAAVHCALYEPTTRQIEASRSAGSNEDENHGSGSVGSNVSASPVRFPVPSTNNTRLSSQDALI